MTRRLRQAFADAGMQPAIAAQSAHWDFLVAMASVGLGVALLPEPLMGRMKTRGLSTAKLAKSGLQWEVGHIWQQSGYLSYAARAWLEVCDEVLGGQNRDDLDMANHPRRNENRSRIGPVLYAPRERQGGRCSPRQSGPADSTIPCHIKETGSQFVAAAGPGLAMLASPGASRSSNPLCFRTPPAPDARRPLARVRPARIAGAGHGAAVGRMVRRRPCRAPGTPAEIEADLASARKQIDDMRKRIANEADDANLQQLYGTAVDIQARRTPPPKP